MLLTNNVKASVGRCYARPFQIFHTSNRKFLRALDCILPASLNFRKFRHCIGVLSSALQDNSAGKHKDGGRSKDRKRNVLARLREAMNFHGFELL